MDFVICFSPATKAFSRVKEKRKKERKKEKEEKDFWETFMFDTACWLNIADI